MAENQLPTEIKLPCLLFAIQHKMDDYGAPDMLYGGLSAEVLRQQYHLRDISTRIDPYTYPNREECARILFDEFRDLSDLFSFYGDSKSLARSMITHMQYGNGTVFSHPMLEQAMAEHSSMKQVIDQLSESLTQYVLLSKQNEIQIKFDEIIKEINKIRLPRFNDFLDRFNSLGITVHDTWATHIFPESFKAKGTRYSAEIRIRIQDHFGLDCNDISNNFYRQFRLLRIWFTLQRWEGFHFRPFITEIIKNIEVEGKLKKMKKIFIFITSLCFFLIGLQLHHPTEKIAIHRTSQYSLTISVRNFPWTTSGKVRWWKKTAMTYLRRWISMSPFTPFISITPIIKKTPKPIRIAIYFAFRRWMPRLIVFLKRTDR